MCIRDSAQPASITELHSSRSTKLHLFLFVLLLHPVYKTAVLLSVEELENPATEATEVVYYLQQFSGKTGWKVNGTRRFGSSQRKISGSNGTSEKVVLFFRMECSKRKYSCSISSKLSLIPVSRGTQRQFSGNICSEDDLRTRIFGTFVVKFLACLPLLGFSNIYKMV